MVELRMRRIDINEISFEVVSARQLAIHPMDTPIQILSKDMAESLLETLDWLLETDTTFAESVEDDDGKEIHIERVGDKFYWNEVKVDREFYKQLYGFLYKHYSYIY